MNARRFDPFLLVVLSVSALFCLHGIGWGRVESWNPDQMALRGTRGLRPGTFRKPPFHTYLNHLFVIIPVQATEMAVGKIMGEKQRWNDVRLIGSRLLVLALHLGMIILGYVVSLRFFGKFAARVSALLLGSSAGLVAYAHFLTCDSPLLFFLLAALFFAERIVRRGETRDYFWAGLLVGLATATKYNGLGAGILIPVAHLLSKNCASLRQGLFSRSLFIGLGMIPAGFLLGNPYAVIDSKRFIADFMYNYEVAPAYGGETGHGYLVFLHQFPELLGWPGTIVLGLAALASLAIVLSPRLRRRDHLAGYLLGLSFVVLYYLKMGAPARVPTRFVLPVIPFLIVLAGPVLAVLQSRRIWIYALLAPIVAYNAFCAGLVGQRFASDPRMKAQSWMIAQVPRGKLIESSDGSPHWALLPELQAMELKAAAPKWEKVHSGETVDLRMPVVNGRAQLFGRIFKGNRWVEAQRRQEGEPDERLFTRAALLRRNPDFITIHSRDTRAPSQLVQAYYKELLAGASPYVVRFNETPKPVSRYVYPRNIDFLGGGIALLERRSVVPVK